VNSQYEAWNHAIGNRFFPEGESGRPAYLAVDDDELNDLGGSIGVSAEAAAQSLATSVARELRRGDSLFLPFLVARTRWRAGGAPGPPPYLAALALSVLAAARMASDTDAGIAPNAYYPRLNALLGRDIHAGMPPGFEQLSSLWQDLDRWLQHDQAGRRGRSTIQSHPHYTNIGWPLSQCLLRESDRRRLPDFFRSVGLDRGTEIESMQLWAMLRNWAHPGCGLSERGLRAIASATGDIEEQLAVIVAREFEDWDGELRDARGRRRGEIALVLEKSAGGRRVAARLVPRRPDGFPEGEYELADGRRLALRGMSDGWFRPLDVEITRRLMSDGLQLSAGSHSLAFEPSPAIPFRASLELGAWVSVRQATAVEEHCLVVHAAALPPLRAFLNLHARAGWRVLDNAGNLPPGWVVVEQVHVASAVEAVPDELRRLAPRLNTATRLEGGLNIAPRQYLTRGEPDLWITIEHGQEATVEIDGTAERLPGGVAEFRLSRSLPPLPPGEHTIVAGGIIRRFTSFPGFPVASTQGTGALGHVLERHAHYVPLSGHATELPVSEPPRGRVYVRGAAARGRGEDLPHPVAPPVLLPVGFEAYEILGARAGELLTAVPPTRPAWLHALGIGDRWQFFDQPVPFEPEWVILQGGFGIRIRAAVDDIRPPEVAAQAGPAELSWSDALLRAAAGGAEPPAEQASQWDAYLEAAATLQERRAG
jgi:hypothetical protein